MEPIDEWVYQRDFLPIAVGERTDCPPKGFHYCPYSRMWRRNLTEAQVQTMWPYAKPKKEAKVIEGPTFGINAEHAAWREHQEALRKDGSWLEDCLQQIGPRAGSDELHSAPTRMLKPEDTSKPPVVDAETAEAITVVLAQVNEFAAEGKLKPADNVVLPKHYARFKIEPIRFICENGLNFFQGNVIKYVLRYDAKNGLEDLKKARRYLNMFILYVEGDPNWWKAA